MTNLPIRRSDSKSGVHTNLNLVVDRDKGRTGDTVIWRYDGPSYQLDADNPSGNHANFGSGILQIQDSVVTAGIDVLVSAAKSGGLQLQVSNTDTSATANTTVASIVASGAAGDPRFRWSISGVVDWVAGLDNSDSDAWVLAASAALGTTNILRITTSTARISADVGIGVAPSYGLHLEKSAADYIARLDNTSSSAGAKVLHCRTAGTAATDAQLVAETTANTAALRGAIAISRNASIKGYIGLDASDNFGVQNASNVVAGHIETNGSTAFWLPTVPAVRATASGTTVGSGVFTVLSMGATDYDTDSMYDSTNHRVKATRAGKYRISGCAEYAGNAGGTLRETILLVNGGTTIANANQAEPAGTFGTSSIKHNVATTYSLAVNDFVDVAAFQDSGGNRTVTGHIAMEFVCV